MNGTITIDFDQHGAVICNATRYKDDAHERQVFHKSDFGDIHGFVSHYMKAINDESWRWRWPESPLDWEEPDAD